MSFLNCKKKIERIFRRAREENYCWCGHRNFQPKVAMNCLRILILAMFVTKTTCQTITQPDCNDLKRNQLDLFFIMDSSTSIHQGNFTKMLNFVERLAQKLDVGENATRVGALQYNGDYTLEFHMNEYYNKDKLIKAIRDITYETGVTHTGQAIRYVVDNEFQPEKGGRNNVPNVAVVITDGFSQDDVVTPSNSARTKGIELIAVGISPSVNLRQLLEIAGGSSSRVFLLDDFESFTDILNSLINQIYLTNTYGCPTKTTKQPGFYSTPPYGGGNGWGGYGKNGTGNEGGEKENGGGGGSSGPLDPFGGGNIVRDVDVRCDDGRMQIVVRSRPSFRGYVFVKGHFDDSACRWNFYNNTEHELFVLLKYDQCGVQRSRSSNPRGIYISTTIAFMKHTQFLTQGDRAYRLQCFYMESEKLVTASLDVSMLPTETITKGIDIPVCQYSLRSETFNGPVIKATTVGTKVFHRWDCEAGNKVLITTNGKLWNNTCLILLAPDTIHMYGIKVHSCFVRNSKGTKKVLVLDETGCAVDKYIMGNLNYSNDLMSASVESEVVKFADSEDILFECQIATCLKENDGCRDVSPPKCQEPHRGKRSSIIADNFNFTEMNPESYDIWSESIIVLDFLHDINRVKSQTNVENFQSLFSLVTNPDHALPDICLANSVAIASAVALGCIVFWFISFVFFTCHRFVTCHKANMRSSVK